MQLEKITANDMKYEEGLEKIEAIISDIENGEMDIDMLSSKIKEAKKYLKECREILTKVEKAIESGD